MLHQSDQYCTLTVHYRAISIRITYSFSDIIINPNVTSIEKLFVITSIKHFNNLIYIHISIDWNVICNNADRIHKVFTHTQTHIWFDAI